MTLKSDRAVSFLESKGIYELAKIAPLTGGANNQVYRVMLSDGRDDFVLKCYHHDSADKRNRFSSEMAFYRWFREKEVETTPKLIDSCSDNRVAQFSYVDGRKMSSEQIEPEHIQKTLDFIQQINSSRDTPMTREIPLASEACFSIEEHVNCVDRRVINLGRIETNDPITQELGSFVARELRPEWESIKKRVRQECVRTGMETTKLLAEHCRIVSPSDFGFHNMMVDRSGQLIFLDFEYAGWDDPAKLICDFFCQPEVPIRLLFWPRILDSISSIFNEDTFLSDRVKTLLPVYQIKWCCIMLNGFTSAGANRRNFAGVNSITHSEEQLIKTVTYFKNRGII